MPQPKGPKRGSVPNLSAQMEDYLETIAHLQRTDRVARSRDIAEKLGVTRATVSAALKSLGEKGLINYQPYSHVTLTQTGEVMSQAIILRHQALSRFFRKVLQIPREQAEENACRAEHVLDPDVIERMVRLTKFMGECPRTNQLTHLVFDQFCMQGRVDNNCKECIGECLASLYTDDSQAPEPTQ